MADDPWAAFADAPAPAAAPAAAPGGADPWAGFADAPAPSAPPAAAPQAPWTLGEAVLPSAENIGHWFARAGQGVPIMGAGVNYAAAALARPFTGGTIADNVATADKMDAEYSAQHPTADAAARFTGATVGTIGELPEWGLGAGTRIAADGVTKVAVPLWERAFGSAVGGATLGTADSVARGEDPTAGAVGGLVGGAAGPVIAKGLGAAYRTGASLFQGAPAGLPDTGRAATNWLRNSVAGMTPEDIAASREATGPAGMFADLNPQTLDLAKSVADQNGPGKAVVRDAFQDRMDARNSRVNAFVSANLGPVQNPTDLKAGWEDQVRANASARDAILADAPPVDASQAVRNLNAARDRFAPTTPENNALARALGWVSEERNPTKVSTWEPDPVGSGITPEMPENLPNPPPYSDTPSPLRPGPVGTQRPMDLQAFVRSLGGIQDRGGDLAAMGYDNLIAKPGQGLGADAMRQAAAQMGYLNHTVDGTSNGATRFSTVNDLLDALGSDNPIYSAHDEDAVHAWAARDAAMQDWQQRGGGDPLARQGGPLQGAPGLPFSGDPGYDPYAAPVRVPLSDATQLHNAKGTFADNVTFNKGVFGDPNTKIGAAEGPYKRAYGDINEALRGQVDGYAANQDATSALSAQQKALELGQADLAPNSDPARYPETFAKTWGELPFGAPEGSLSDIQAARQAGMRFALAAALGNKANDFQAAKQALQGEGGWNAANLRTAFGQAPVDAVERGVDQEVQLARNSQHVIGGSPTNENQQIRRLTSPEGMNGAVAGLADWADNFTWGRMSSWVPPALQPRNLYNRAMEGSAERARAQLAPHLVKTGAERDALIQALLAQRQRQAALLPPAMMDPLVRAMVQGGAQYARQ